MDTAPVQIAVENAVAVVTLNRPAKRNAMTLAMWQDIATIFNRLGADPDVRAIILTGAGGNFSVGADVSEFAAVRATKQQSVAYEVAVDAASDAIMAAPKPVIAVLEGYCLGGGCHLSMACDFRYANAGAQIGIPAAKLSIVYGVRSTQRLLALVGLTHAKRLLYAAERIDAGAALRIGLIDEMSSNPMSGAKTFAASLAALAPLSIAGAKQILTGLSMGPGALNQQQAQSFIDFASDSDDYREGREAFQEKRQPRFRGR
jgi:enoyl-CoA hydratase/carnithine racemase